LDLDVIDGPTVDDPPVGVPAPAPPEGGDGPSPATSGWRDIGRRAPWWARPTAIFAASRAVVGLGLYLTAVVGHRTADYILGQWDTWWFINAARRGWPSHVPMAHGHAVRSTIAFFPVFPLAVRYLTRLTGWSLLTSSLTISMVTGLTAMITVWALVRRYAGPAAADRATLLLAVFPGSFVISLGYSEGILITAVACGLLALQQRRWVLAGLAGLVATGTAPVALAFVAACLWCAVSAIRHDRQWRALAAPLLAPVGFVTYQLWLWAHTGDLSAWRATERGGWHSYPSPAYPVHLLVTVLVHPIGSVATDKILVVGIVFTAICAVVAVRDRQPPPVLIYGLGAALLAVVSAPVGLRPRFILDAFPLILALGVRLRGVWYVVVVSTSAVVMVVFTVYSIGIHSVFP
jgi:hypothetical protein